MWKFPGAASLNYAPLTFMFLRNWLNDFSYRIPMSWWIFVMAGMISAVIVVGTIGLNSLKIAFSNPARVLKSE